jgi:hypothetical protein
LNDASELGFTTKSRAASRTYHDLIPSITKCGKSPKNLAHFAQEQTVPLDLRYRST